MIGYLTIEQAAEYLSVSTDTIKRYVEKGQIPAYKLERALRFKRKDLDDLLSRSLELLLVPGLRAVVRHVVTEAEGVDSWRVMVALEDTTGKNRVTVSFGSEHQFTAYYVFVSAEYLEDHANLPGTVKGAEKFALRYIGERFEETRDENGNRDITRIGEDRTRCSNGRCVKVPIQPLNEI